MRDLVIKKGGLLVGKSKSQPTRDYTNLASECLFDVCTLDEDITLEDVFLLINKNLDKLSPILGNWCEEHIKEGLRATSPKEFEVEFVELYWRLDIDDYSDKNKPSLSGLNFPRLHGVGYIHKEDHLDDDGLLMAEKGTRTNYAIEFTPTYELAKLPLKLNNEVAIFKDFSSTQVYHDPTFTLGHILHGIMWELSFCGSPAERDKMNTELCETVKGIKDGTIRTELLDFDDLE